MFDESYDIEDFKKNDFFGLDIKLTPWKETPYSLIDWKIMLEFSAGRFLWCGYELRSIKVNCIFNSYIGSGDDPILNLSKNIDERTCTKALTSLKTIENEMREIGLNLTASTVNDVLNTLEKNKRPLNTQWLYDQIENIEKLMGRELQNHAFFFVPADHAKYFPKIDDPFLFGKSVAKAFPDASYDIAESGKCLALARHTACIFHLMRILEIGLKVLGNKFEVSLEHTNWAPAIDQIESKIRDMHKDPKWKSLPDCKDQQEFYAQAASHFAIFKDAWRNYTMHMRGKYTEDEAILLFENTKAFMQKLAEKFTE
jgi:hypothetical protein